MQQCQFKRINEIVQYTITEKQKIITRYAMMVHNV